MIRDGEETEEAVDEGEEADNTLDAEDAVIAELSPMLFALGLDCDESF